MKITEKEYDELCSLVNKLQIQSLTYGVTRFDSDYEKMHSTWDTLINKFAVSIDIFDDE